MGRITDTDTTGVEVNADRNILLSVTSRDIDAIIEIDAKYGVPYATNARINFDPKLRARVG